MEVRPEAAELEESLPEEAFRVDEEPPLVGELVSEVDLVPARRRDFDPSEAECSLSVRAADDWVCAEPSRGDPDARGLEEGDRSPFACDRLPRAPVVRPLVRLPSPERPRSAVRSPLDLAARSDFGDCDSERVRLAEREEFAPAFRRASDRSALPDSGFALGVEAPAPGLSVEVFFPPEDGGVFEVWEEGLDASDRREADFAVSLVSPLLGRTPAAFRLVFRPSAGVAAGRVSLVRAFEDPGLEEARSGESAVEDEAVDVAFCRIRPPLPPRASARPLGELDRRLFRRFPSSAPWALVPFVRFASPDVPVSEVPVWEMLVSEVLVLDVSVLGVSVSPVSSVAPSGVFVPEGLGGDSGDVPVPDAGFSEEVPAVPVDSLEVRSMPSVRAASRRFSVRSASGERVGVEAGVECSPPGEFGLPDAAFPLFEPASFEERSAEPVSTDESVPDAGAPFACELPDSSARTRRFRSCSRGTFSPVFSEDLPVRLVPSPPPAESGASPRALRSSWPLFSSVTEPRDP